MATLKIIYRLVFLLPCLVLFWAVLPVPAAHAAERRWTPTRAWEWYHRLPWLVGCDYIPATADNTLEMWQKATFDPETINRELGYAQKLGFNCLRVFLNALVWEHNPAGYRERLERFLKIAQHHHIRVIFVFFDDCWNPTSHLGPQPQPVEGVHNSQWVQCPGPAALGNRAVWPKLKAYEQGVMRTFAHDHRVILWDLYNEAGNSGNGLKTLPLLKAVFRWAAAVNPSQPITSCVYGGPAKISHFVLSHSDIITFHNYNGPRQLQREIIRLKKLGRPVICTEYMRRPISTFAGSLPIFKRYDVGCLNWGLTNGKTQTIFPWGSKPGTPPPKIWFHDILHRDGKPFSVKEVHLIERYTGAAPWPAK